MAESPSGAVVNPAPAHVESQEGASDAALAARAAQGDDVAFALLYHRHTRDVWNLASFKLRDAHEAEDVVQETFLRAYRGLESFRGGPESSARPWLLSICRNLCLDRLRVVLARGTTFLADHPAVEPAAVAGDADRTIDLRRGLAALEHEDAEAFFLVDVLGCRSHEAAAIVGVRASSTVRSRVDRARRQLAAAVAEPLEPSTAPEVWGVFHTPPERALVVSYAAAASSGAMRQDTATRTDRELVRFFDRLEAQIPAGRQVLAVLGEPSPPSVDAAGPWIAHHPRWRLRLSRSPALWLRDAERLLGGERRETLERLRAAEPFVWTVGR